MSVTISLFAPARANHQAEHAIAFSQGLARHGIKTEIRDPQAYKPCDLAIFWGHRYERIITGQRAIGARYLVMERGYIGDRFKWTSLGYDGLNGRADFPLRVTTDPARLQANFPDLLKAPARRGDRVIVMGQVEGDAALAHVDINRWYQEVGYKVRMAGHTPHFRPHPLSKSRAPSRFQLIPGTLEQVMAAAGRVITFNSNSGVDAVVAGIPTIAYDPGSMAWDVTSHDVDAPDYRPSDAARLAWAAGLAWCQWKIDEIRNGDAWAAIGPYAAARSFARVG